MSLLLNTDYKIQGTDSDDEPTPNRSLAKEAHRVADEIKFGTEQAYVSSKLVSSESIAFINIKTLEKEEWCIQLTGSGYAVVGNLFDSITNDSADNHEETYETVEALMNRISPKYMTLFNESVALKLKQLM